jgi:Phage tail baseplate hub (GPD)
MPLNVTVSFPSSADASAVVAAGLKVRRYELREAASELFELTLEVLSTGPAIAERAIAGQAAVVGLGDEPFVTQVSGIVRQVEQRTAVLSGDSLYAWTVVPPLWLTTRRRDHRIFQDMSVPAIVAAVLAGPSYGGRIPAPATLLGDHPPREYVVQYAETDWEFLSRILADEGIASFFDHANGSAWTLIDDTAASAPDMTSGAIPFRDPSLMNDPGTPHVQTAILRSAVETSAVTLRAYDFEKPAFKLEAKKASDAGAAFANESAPPSGHIGGITMKHYSSVKDRLTTACKYDRAMREAASLRPYMGSATRRHVLLGPIWGPKQYARPPGPLASDRRTTRLPSGPVGVRRQPRGRHGTCAGGAPQPGSGRAGVAAQPGSGLEYGAQIDGPTHHHRNLLRWAARNAHSRCRMTPELRQVQHRHAARSLRDGQRRDACAGRRRVQPLRQIHHRESVRHRERPRKSLGGAIERGDIGRLARRIEREAPWTIADFEALHDRARRDVDHRHLRRVLDRHERLRAVGRERHRAGAERAQVDLGDDLIVLEVDDRELLRLRVGDEEHLAAGVDGHAVRVRTLGHGDLTHLAHLADVALGRLTRERPRIDAGHVMRAPDRHVGEASVRRDGHVARIAAHGDPAHLLATGEIDDRDAVVARVGDQRELLARMIPIPRGAGPTLIRAVSR